MITIKNFEKLHLQEFEVWDTKFHIELYMDGDNPVGLEQEIWITSEGDIKYVLFLQPNFVERTMKIRRCLLGEGKDGDDLETISLKKELVETMERFKKFIVKYTYDNFNKLN